MKANDILDLISKIIAPDSYESDKDEGMHGGKSLYYTSDMGVVTRVPNHRAYHRTFQDRATKFGMPARIFSIVFEDEATVGNNILRRPIKKPFQIHEYIYPLWQEGHELEEWEVRKIAKAIIESGNGTFQDPTGKAVYLPRWSQNPPQPKTTTQTTSNNHNKSRNNQQQTIKNKKKRKRNESKNMKKNVIKLNENTLRQIIAESVKKVLNERQLDNLDSFSRDDFEDAFRVAAHGDNEDWDEYTKVTNPYQDIIDRLTPISKELRNLSEQSEDNALNAYIHIVKALDLLRYPYMRRD